MGKKLTQILSKTFLLKILVLVFLAGFYKILENSKFESIDFLIRDTLQFLNSTKEVDESFVTLNINSNTGNFITFEHLKQIVELVQQQEPKNIIIMFEPLDFETSKEKKLELFNYLNSHKNVYLNMYEARNELASFAKDEIFRNFERRITFDRCMDSPKDRESRRAFLAFNSLGEAEIFHQLRQLGYVPVPLEKIEFKFERWNTQQALIKSYQLGTFGNFQSSDLLANKLGQNIFKNKTILIGRNDEFSMLTSKSTFSLFSSRTQKNIQSTRIPLQDVFAGILNFHTTGNYIKYLSQVNELLVVTIILAILLLLNFNLLYKLYIFLSLVPFILITEICIYLFGDFYIDVSRSLVLLVTAQYFSLPFIVIYYFKKSEEHRLLDINNARIDALFTLSSSLAHDLRSPLSTLQLLISKAHFSSDEQKQLVKSALNRLDSMIESLIKKHSGYQEEIRQPVNVSALIRNILEEKKIKSPETEFKDFLGAEVVVKVNGEGLQRVISNILDNSIDALAFSKQRTIKISLLEEKDKTSIVIEDSGAGISKSVLSLLGKQMITTKANSNGNGLGLLHSTRLIEKMGGTLNFDSTEGNGTKVSISLPNGD